MKLAALRIFFCEKKIVLEKTWLIKEENLLY